jgi:hypothetical protein
VVVLSYDKKAPENRFLVSWLSGTQEFVFRCRWTGDHFEKIELPVPIHDPSTAVLDETGFGRFRDFLHAVRIWDLAGGWTLSLGDTGCR